MKHWFLVAYDVADDKRLRRVAKTLEGYGVRCQYSIFRCSMSDREAERLRWELAKIMAADDSLLLLRLCDACVERLRAANKPDVWPDDPPRWIVI